MADAPKLKLCPFCGGQPQLLNEEMALCAFVMCLACGAQGDDRSAKRAVFAWNNRADLVPQWMDIKTAPKDGTDILVGFGNGDRPPVVAIWLDGWVRFESATPLGIKPTHWMPLPAPPAKKGGDA